MGLPGNGTIPAVYAERIRLAKRAGAVIMDADRAGTSSRADLLDERQFRNALASTWRSAAARTPCCTCRPSRTRPA